MPFGGWFDAYYSDIYVPAISEAGLKPHRADDIYRPSAIVHDIWSYTKQCRLVLADLTGKNPNVFYELGLAHALAKPAILVAESIEDVPFDLRALRVIQYDKNAPDWGTLLKEKIRTSIEQVLKAPQEAVLPAFLNVRNTTEAPTVSAQEKQFIEVKQELDLLRREMRSMAVRNYRRTELPPEPEEARAIIQRYVSMGMPRSMILERLDARGVPPAWTHRELDRIRESSPQREMQLGLPKTSPDEGDEKAGKPPAA